MQAADTRAVDTAYHVTPRSHPNWPGHVRPAVPMGSDGVLALPALIHQGLSPAAGPAFEDSESPF